MPKPEIRTRYEEHDRVQLNCTDPSRTKQSFAEEADINNLMQKYIQTGILVDGEPTRQFTFGDFSNGTDFQEVQEKILAARQDFSTLSSNVRERFNNDPSELLDFASDPANKAECIKMGIIPDYAAKVLPEEPAPPAELPLEEAEPTS
ncbi:internal scaffolding protein [Microviridae sp.]|nr:internal scaffolding protein [Microviridae sp.]